MEIDDTSFEDSGMELGHWMVATGRCKPDGVQRYRDAVLAGGMSIGDCEAMPPSAVNSWTAEGSVERPVVQTPQAVFDQDFNDLFTPEGLARQRAEVEAAASGVQPDGRRMPGLASRPPQRYGRATDPGTS